MRSKAESTKSIPKHPLNPPKEDTRHHRNYRARFLVLLEMTEKGVIDNSRSDSGVGLL